MSVAEREIILGRAKDWFRQKLAVNHRENTLKLKNINELQINPLLLKYLGYYFEGNDDPETLAKVLVYPRVLGSSITTSFGTSMQRSFITDVLGAYGSVVSGIDIEFDDKVDGRHKYCQLKSGPNAINRDDVTTIKNHFRSVINLGRTNNSGIQAGDLVFCLTYGEEHEKNSFIRELEQDYTVYIGQEFWYHFTGDEDFYEELIKSFADVAKEFNLKEIVDEVVQSIADQLKTDYKYL